jgi:hypothetical protein
MRLAAKKGDRESLRDREGQIRDAYLDEASVIVVLCVSWFVLLRADVEGEADKITAPLLHWVLRPLRLT